MIIGMRTVFTAFMSVCLAAVLMSCVQDDNSSDGQLSRDVYGHWFYIEDNELSCLTFNPDGSGDCVRHIWKDSEWTEETYQFDFTVSDEALVFNTEEGVWMCPAAVTGGSMSVSAEGRIIVMTRYSGNIGDLEEQKRYIEENWIENGSGHLDPDEFPNTEKDLLTIVDALYEDLVKFVENQLQLERIRLTHEDFYGNEAYIEPYGDYVEDAWNAVYEVIYKSTYEINRLGSLSENEVDMTQSAISAYTNEVKALKSMAMFGAAQLWGQVVDVTDCDAGEYAIMSAESTYSALENMLLDIDSDLPEHNGSYRISAEAVKALRAEIALTCGDMQKAGDLLKNCRADFSLSIAPNSYTYELFGDAIPVYTPVKIDLLLQEANMGEDGSASDLDTSWNRNKLYYGYWPMLKRTGLAQSVSGCEDHELLMPIPAAVLMMMDDMYQNPGY